LLRKVGLRQRQSIARVSQSVRTCSFRLFVPTCFAGAEGAGVAGRCWCC